MAENKLQEYICPNCSGPLEFKGDVQKMVCIYCESSFDMSQFSDQSPKAGDEAPAHWEQARGSSLAAGTEGMKEYECNACGAVMVSDGQVGATECPYCGNPAIIESTFAGLNLPDGIIPFAVDKKAAEQAMADFYKGKKLLPKNFADSNRMEHIQGVYVPFWLFDCDVSGSVFYKAENRRSVRRGNETWEEIDEYAVSRSAKMRYEKVPADGSKEMRDEYMDSLEPFDYGKLIAYNSAYFSGYLASKYDMDADAVKARVNKRIINTSEEAIRETVKGYDSVVRQSGNINIQSGKISYCMLPVWMLTTRYNNQPYTFAMNGQTGKVTGDLPIDNSRATALFFKTTLIAMIVIELIMYFLTSRDGLAPIPLVIGALVALMIGYFTLSSAKSAMVSHTKLEAGQYLVQGSFRLNSQSDRHLGTRERLVNSGSSGGGPGGPNGGRR